MDMIIESPVLALEPGQTLVVSRNGRTVVQALQPTHVAVQ